MSTESRTRDQIVTATRKLIEDRGVAHITSKHIAKAAGCAEGTIFRYFARKEDLLLAAVMASFPPLREALESIRGGTPRDRLQRLGLNVLRFFDQITPAAVAVASDAELRRRHLEIVREHNGGPQRIYAVVTRFIESEQSSGALRADRPAEHIASALLGSCFFRVFTRLSLGRNVLELSDEEFVGGVVEALWEGVRRLDGKSMRSAHRGKSAAGRNKE
jgi:AcrR family transcriptional regulator